MDRKRILIVEDDQDILRGMMIRLRAHGYETLFATDGVQATQIVRRENPDLVILDLGLPAGDGYTLMERWKSLTAFMSPIVVVSAREAATHEERALAAGAVAFLQKPVEAEDLLAAVEDALATV